MPEVIEVYIFYGLPIWWVSQIVLCVMGYMRQRRSGRLRPTTPEQIELEARRCADAPQKPTLGWMLRNPGEALKRAWWFPPVALAGVVVFWPLMVALGLVALFWPKIPPEMIARFREERQVARDLAAAELARYEVLGFDAAQARVGRPPEVREIVGRDQRAYRIKSEVETVTGETGKVFAICTVRDLTLPEAVAEWHDERLIERPV